jgi:hypothetical protein
MPATWVLSREVAKSTEVKLPLLKRKPRRLLLKNAVVFSFGMVRFSDRLDCEDENGCQELSRHFKICLGRPCV